VIKRDTCFYEVQEVILIFYIYMQAMFSFIWFSYLLLSINCSLHERLDFLMRLVVIRQG